MNNIDSTLNERGSRYGDFEEHAFITQDLKAVMQETPNWDLLKADQKEALEMTAHKIGRILNGDPNYLDSWHDIIGYVRLVEQRLEREQREQVTVGPEQATVGPEQPSQAAKKVDESLGAFISRLIREDSVPPATARTQLSILAELRAMFPTADITVAFESEESGETD